MIDRKARSAATFGDPVLSQRYPTKTRHRHALIAVQAGPAVISINRGHWGPYCRLELHALAAQFGDIRRSGASCSIMQDVAEFTRRFRAEQSLPFPILSDVDLGYSLLLGLVFWVGPEVRRLNEELGVDRSFQRNASYFLAIAAKFIVADIRRNDPRPRGQRGIPPTHGPGGHPRRPPSALTSFSGP